MATHAPEPTLRPVVVVPCFNNGRTVGSIIQRILEGGWSCVVVDDGSTDDTAGALDALQHPAGGTRLEVLRHGHNRGKAAALATGFDHARQAGATHAITLDADGQHDPEQADTLWACAQAHPACVGLGERPVGPGSGAPWRSRIGRRVSNTLVRWQCGLRVADTQTGFRVYPLGLLGELSCRFSRYAFETEVLVRAARAGLGVVGVPIASRYMPGDERVSHFQPLRDSAHSIAMHASLLPGHRVTSTLPGRWARKQLLYLPLGVFLLIGALRSGLPSEPRWHPAFLTASAIGLLVLAGWRKLKLGYEPVPIACLLFLFTGAVGVLLRGTSLYPIMHENYGALEELALLLWVAVVCVGVAVARPAWLLGRATLPRPRAGYDVWCIAGGSVVAVFLGLALHGLGPALAGAVPFVFVLLVQGTMRLNASHESTDPIPGPGPAPHAGDQQQPADRGSEPA